MGIFARLGKVFISKNNFKDCEYMPLFRNARLSMFCYLIENKIRGREGEQS